MDTVYAFQRYFFHESIASITSCVADICGGKRSNGICSWFPGTCIAKRNSSKCNELYDVCNERKWDSWPIFTIYSEHKICRNYKSLCKIYHPKDLMKYIIISLKFALTEKVLAHVAAFIVCVAKQLFGLSIITLNLQT